MALVSCTLISRLHGVAHMPLLCSVCRALTEAPSTLHMAARHCRVLCRPLPLPAILTAYLVTWLWLQLPSLSVVLGQPVPPLWVTAEVSERRTQAAGSAQAQIQLNSLMPQGGHHRELISPELVPSIQKLSH